MQLLPQQRRKAADLFPEPAPGVTVDRNPPAFCWLRVEGVTGYRLEVRDEAGTAVISVETGTNCYLPPKTLPPGEYSWNLYADHRERGWSNFRIVPETPVFLPPRAEEILNSLPAAHPRHLYRPGDAERLRERYPDEIKVLRRNIVLALSRECCPYPGYHRPDATTDYRRMIGVIREHIDRDLVALALGHFILGDRAAGERARHNLLAVCEWNPAGPCSVDAPWGDEIGLSLCRCLPAVFDWTYDLYTEEERLFIVQTIAQHAAQIHRLLLRQDFMSRPGNSHSGRLPAYLGEAALVLAGKIDRPLAITWLQYALDVYGSFFPFYGGADGGWVEGPFYASSYTKWYLPFFLSVERLSGFSFLNRPFFRHVSQFFLHFATPGWEIHPFADGYWCHTDDPEWPGFFARNPFGIYAERFGPPLAEAFFRAMPEPEYYKLHLLDIFIPEQLCPPGDAEAAGPATDSRLFPDTGLVSFRRNLADPENDLAVLARCSRFGAASHQHADQGSFAVISHGRALISPSGYFGFCYGSPHHRLWTQQTIAHNCILVDGVGQHRDDPAAVGRIVSFADDGKLATTEFDLIAAYPMLRSYRRRLRFERDTGILTVSDEVSAEQPVAVSWLLHSLSRPEGNAEEVRLVRPPAELMLAFSSTAAITDFTITDRFATAVNEGMPPEQHVDFPKQYHMTWQLAKEKEVKIDAVFHIS